MCTAHPISHYWIYRANRRDCLNELYRSTRDALGARLRFKVRACKMRALLGIYTFMRTRPRAIVWKTRASSPPPARIIIYVIRANSRISDAFDVSQCSVYSVCIFGIKSSGWKTSQFAYAQCSRSSDDIFTIIRCSHIVGSPSEYAKSIPKMHAHAVVEAAFAYVECSRSPALQPKQCVSSAFRHR